MIYYILPILFSYILSFFKIGQLNKNGNSVKWSIYILTIVIFCFGYMTGSDWRTYELMYNSASIDNLFSVREKGFHLLMLVFKFFKIPFFPFLIICKVFSFSVFVKFFKKISTNVFLPLAIFLSTDALFILVDNPLRFMLALSIALIAYKELLERKHLAYILWILLAITFHISALILLPVMLLINNKIFMRRIVICVIYFFLLFSLTPEVAKPLLEPFLLYFPSIYFYYNRLFLHDFSIFTIGSIMHVLLFIVTILNRDYIVSTTKYGKEIYNCAIIYYLVAVISSPVPTFFRLSLFFAPFSYLALSWVLIKYAQSGKTVVLTCFMVSYFLLSTYSKIERMWMYNPYSNYLTYLFKEKPSFSERCSYNIIKHYQRTGERIENMCPKLEQEKN